MPKQQLKRRNFTLIELVVSMGVFSILMLALMMFFNGSQKIWTASEKRCAVYADSRVAMDIICNTLQSAVIQKDYNAAKTLATGPFYITALQGSIPYQYNRIALFSDAPMPFNAQCFSRLYKVAFFLDQGYAAGSRANNLCVRYFGDYDVAGSNTYSCWNDFQTSTYYDGEIVSSTNIFNKTGSSFLWPTTTPTLNTDNAGVYDKVIIQYVLGLTFTAYKKKSAAPFIEVVNLTSTDYTECPYAIAVTLTVLDKKSYEKWISMGGDGVPVTSNANDKDGANTARGQLLMENARTFTRMIYLGNRF